MQRRLCRRIGSVEESDLSRFLTGPGRPSLVSAPRRGQIRLVQGGGAASVQVVQTLSDSDDDNDSAWEGRLGDRYNPPVDSAPDTRDVESNEIKTQIQLANGMLGCRRADRSIPQLLRQLSAQPAGVH
uniref:Uncharacterized protein n=1 Tax=Gopherus evgoodei TaxID=1825980 RepID=A0A8C4WQP6_9SAUR